MVFGIISYPRFAIINSNRIRGTEVLERLDTKNVLFVSNHQTYFADVAMMYHVFLSSRWGFRNKITNPIYLLKPRSNVYYVAARETMKAGLLPKIFSYSGSISIKRTWREAGKEVQRNVDRKDLSNISQALSSGWVITFPQGTTTPFKEGRRGTAHMIKDHKPIVVPIVINGFRRAFDKKGLRVKKKGVELSMHIKPPLEINYNDSVDVILSQIMNAIQQTDEFNTMEKIKNSDS